MADCGAKTRKGTPCQQPEGHGTNHPGVGRCSIHGGTSPRAELAGVVLLARREATAVMGIALDVEPKHAIVECIRISAGEVFYSSDRIAELGPDDVIGPLTTRHRRPMKEEKGGEDPSREVEEVELGPPELHKWIIVRQQAMDRLVTYSATALKNGIEEREVEIAKEQAERLAQALGGILKELGVISNPEAPNIVRRHLTLLNAGPV